MSGCRETQKAAGAMRRKRLWLIEIWDEEREAFKSIVGHGFLFLTVFGILLLVHYVIHLSSLHDAQKAIIVQIDFWGIVITLVMLTVSSIAKVFWIVIKHIIHDA